MRSLQEPRGAEYAERPMTIQGNAQEETWKSTAEVRTAWIFRKEAFFSRACDRAALNAEKQHAHVLSPSF